MVQRADLYVVDLRSRSQRFRGELPAPPDHRNSFSPWLLGWEGESVHFKITGCPGSPGSECYGPLVRTSAYTLSATGHIAPSAGAASPVLASSRDEAAGYMAAGVEPYGVSASTRLGSPRAPLLRFVGLRLEVVPAQGLEPPRSPLATRRLP